MYIILLFDNWKFIFHSKLAQLSRLNKLKFHISLNNKFPDIYTIRNAYLRNYIKSVKHEFYILSSIDLFIWSNLMNICFNIFFYKKIQIKKILFYICCTIIFLLLLVLLFYVFFIKIPITYNSLVIDLLIPYTMCTIKFSQNIFTYLILIGL